MEFTAWLEGTAVSTWIRTSTSIWALPTILTLHTFGLAILAGTNSVFALRILGIASGVPIAPLERLFRVIWVGFAISAATGTALFVSAATLKGSQPIFFVKLLLVALGMVNVSLLRTSTFHGTPDVRNGVVSLRAKVLAAASLVIWTGVITVGRFMAYV